ncbi:MAG: hypothetical protein ACM3PZ_01640 [Bacillota bacterium]
MNTKEAVPAVESVKTTKLELWEENMHNSLLQELKKGKTLDEALHAFSGFNEAFRELDTIDCSDGRVLGGRKIGLAGSGILLSAEEKEAFIQANKGKVKKVTSHEDCGAAKLAYSLLESKPEGMTADEYGRKLAMEFAAALGAEHEFLPMGEMAEEHHNEAGLTIDGTGKFDSTNLFGFPPHFVCSAAGFGISDEYVVKEADTLIGITFGGHGFGELITKEDPFRLMVIARDKEQADRLLQAVKPIVDKYEGRVKAEAVIRASMTV